MSESSSATVHPAGRTPLLWVLWILWSLAALIGCFGLYQRLIHGGQAANFTSYVPWGLWVAGYIYFSGLSAGAFLLSATAYAFKVRALEPVGPVCLFTAVVTLPMGLLTIWLDLGHLERFYMVFSRPQPQSMMAWIVWLYTAYLIVLIAMLTLSVRSALPARDPALAAKDQAMLRVLGILGIPVVIGFAGGVGALFGTVAAREFWHTSLLPVFFLVGALTTGTALVTAIVSWCPPSRDAAWKDRVVLLGRIVLTLVIIELIFEWSEFSIPAWYQIGPGYEIVRYILTGPYWYGFWLVHILMGVIVPILLLVKTRRPAIIGLAAALVAISFFAVRLNLVIPGLAAPEFRGLAEAYTDPIGGKLAFAYMPTWFEWQVLLGVIAVGAALWFAGARLLPRGFWGSSQSDEVGS